MMNNKLKLSAFLVGLVVAIGGTFLWAHAQFSETPPVSVLVQGDYNFYEATKVTSVEAPALGAISSADYLPDRLCSNDECVVTLHANFNDATTTLVWFVSPFTKATSTASDVVITRDEELVGGMGLTVASTTVEMARVYLTGATTSTFSFVCGGAVSTSSAPVYNLITSDSVPTSTLGVVENGIANSQGTNIGGGSVQKSMLGPAYPYFVCKATMSANNWGVGAFTDVGNTSDGKAVITVSRMRF